LNETVTNEISSNTIAQIKKMGFSVEGVQKAGCWLVLEEALTVLLIQTILLH
jgi:hypothetical protein